VVVVMVALTLSIAVPLASCDGFFFWLGFLSGFFSEFSPDFLSSAFFSAAAFFYF
jgi:hypothetical protein